LGWSWHWRDASKRPAAVCGWWWRQTFDDARLGACECVELPGELPETTLAENFTMFECDALADPGFHQDGLVRALATRLGLPYLDRGNLLTLLTSLHEA